MFQKEVADRILSKEDTKKYSRISVISQWLMNVERICDVKSKSFFPSPKVESSILLFKPKKNYFYLKNIKNLEHVTNVFFNLRRKMIKKPINILFKNTDFITEKLNLDLSIRPEKVSPNLYYKICNEYESLT